jgi:hypothetical protein
MSWQDGVWTWSHYETIDTIKHGGDHIALYLWNEVVDASLCYFMVWNIGHYILFNHGHKLHLIYRYVMFGIHWKNMM